MTPSRVHSESDADIHHWDADNLQKVADNPPGILGVSSLFTTPDI